METLLKEIVPPGISQKKYPNRIEYLNENGYCHREDGPAIEYNDGRKEWFINGERHRLDGPAIEYNNGTRYWFINDKRHREDGPAIEWVSGKLYFLDDINYSEDDFHQEVIKLKLNRIKNL